MPYRHLTQRIDAHLERLSPELQRAARWVREHPAELSLQSMRESARAAGVSAPSMTRLAQALGFAGFEAMREPMIDAARALAEARTPADAPPAGSALARRQATNLASVGRLNPPEALDAAAAAVLAAREVVFVGQRASFGMAYHLHYTCDWLRPGTRLAADPGGAWLDAVAALEPPDLLVAVGQAPYAAATVQALALAQAREVPVLALTDAQTSPLAQAARHVLRFDTASPAFFHSMVGVQALVEALVDAVARLGGEPVLRRLRARQQALQRHRVYWAAPRARAAETQDAEPNAICASDPASLPPDGPRS